MSLRLPLGLKIFSKFFGCDSLNVCLKFNCIVSDKEFFIHISSIAWDPPFLLGRAV